MYTESQWDALRLRWQAYEWKPQDLREYGFSNRVVNSLFRGKVLTADALFRLSYENLMKCPNMGSKSFRDLMEVLEAKAVPESESQGKDGAEEVSVPHLSREDTVQSPLIPGWYVAAGYLINRQHARIIPDLALDITDLSPRTRNGLKCNGIKTAGELLLQTKESIVGMKNMSSASLGEILKKIPTMLLEKALTSGLPSDPILHEACRPEDVRDLYREDPFCRYSYDKICLLLPDDVDRASVSPCLENLLRTGKIRLSDDGYEWIYPGIFEYISRPEIPEKYRNRMEVLRRRFRGATLEEIGDERGLTRERIRQSEARGLRYLEQQEQVFSEDRYRYLFETYDLPKEFYADTLSPYLQYYLNLRYTKGCRPAEETLTDRHLSVALRRKIEDWLRRDYIFADGVYVGKDRRAIEEYLLETYCKDEISLDDFFALYNRFLSDHGLSGNPEFSLHDNVRRTRENRLMLSRTVLWKHNQKLRYYNVDAMDYTELFRELDLGQYRDIEISTYKFIRELPDVMKRYDIRDEYELHNLLKKLDARSENPTLVFSRMPNLRFGTFDRNAAVREILFAMAPVRPDDLAEQIEEIYGQHRHTAMINWFGGISEYLHNGLYTVTNPPMDPDRMAKLKSVLTEDFYFFREIREIYASLFQTEDVSPVCPYNLKQMGFTPYSSYVLQNQPSAEKYFRSLLITEDEADRAAVCKKYTGLSTFAQALANLKKERQIVEIRPYYYIGLPKLESMGIDRKAMEDYCDSVFRSLRNEVYFTVHSLRKAGFTSPLDDAPFDDLFYASLLKEDGRFSWQNAGNTVVFTAREEEFSVQDILLCFLQSRPALTVTEFRTFLRENYDIHLDRSGILERLKGTRAYLDSISGTLYPDFETYRSTRAGDGEGF